VFRQIPHKLIQTDVVKFVRAALSALASRRMKKRVAWNLRASACGNDCHSIAGGAIRNNPSRPCVCARKRESGQQLDSCRERQRQYSGTQDEPPHDCFFGTMAVRLFRPRRPFLNPFCSWPRLPARWLGGWEAPWKRAAEIFSSLLVCCRRRSRL
jgi:hypothetical protein